MRNFNPPEFSIKVNQEAVLTGDIDSKKAQLVLYENNLEVDILNNEYFGYVDYSAARYELVVEYLNDSSYHIWNIDLKVIDLECNDFTIIKNEDYFELQHFISKFNLNEKLSSDLPVKSLKINNSKKI